MQLNNPEIRIEPTNRCNGNCIMCPRSEMTRPRVTMDYGHFKNLVEQALLIGAESVTLTGFGEPLMDGGIFDKIHLCSTLGLKTFITTNATLLTGGVSNELLNAGLSHIRFSVHGIGANYERVHRGFDWARTMTNIYRFLKINQSINGNQCKAGVVAIPMHNEDPESFIFFWQWTAIDYIEIWRPHGWAGMKQYRRETKTKLKTCGRPTMGPIQIQADGKVIPCCFITNGEIILGDTHKDSIEDIVKGNKYHAFRTRFLCGDLKGLPCERCDQLYIGDNPLLYSSRDPERNIHVTNSTKFKLRSGH